MSSSLLRRVEPDSSSSSRSVQDVRAFVEARTRLAASDEACAVLERAMAESARRLLVRAHKLALHAGSEEVNARDLVAAVRFELPTAIADAAEANMALAVRRAIKGAAT